MSAFAAPRVHPFDVCGRLPSGGVTVLEASAGTGKTYTIAGLAARYLAAGVELEQMLLVTFGRNATTELRERVRERLTRSERALSAVERGEPPPGSDELDRLLARGSAEDVALRRRRLTRGVTNFDAMTIATVHRFCQVALSDLGVLSDVEREVTFSEQLDDLVEEVVDDLYLRAFWRPSGVRLSRDEVGQIVKLAVAHPTAPLVPASPGPGSAALRRCNAALAARKELERRKRRGAVITYDDFLTRLLETLSGPNGEAAVRRLRERFRVVLIDEFQDTDPNQWEIIRRAFAHEGIALVLIADPKQAIYAFRGADVYAYLRARAQASATHDLTTNWRSDGDLLAALDVVFRGADLGHPGIAYRRVEPAPGHEGSRLRGDAEAPLQFRIVRGDAPGVRTYSGYATKSSARPALVRDLAFTVVGLLGGHLARDTGSADAPSRPVVAGDIAVLVRSHYTAEAVHAALREAGVPSVVGGAGSVLRSPAAVDWRALLAALERPGSPQRASRAAMTSFLGLSAAELAAADEGSLDAIHRRLHRWARILRGEGVAALLSAVMREEGLAARVLEAIGGERTITDLRHVGQLLHRASTAEGIGPTALLGWLEHRMDTAEDRNSDQERSRRLESDAAAVQVMTIHRSKGLEFPIVLCPDLWDWWDPYAKGNRPLAFHEPMREYELMLDVGLDEDLGYGAHRDRARREELGELLRLTYVALTRAMHRSIVWWVGARDCTGAGLKRLLFDRDEAGSVREGSGPVPRDDVAEKRLRELAAAADGLISVERCHAGEARLPAVAPPEDAELEAARFTRELDLLWRRSSYTSITSAAYESAVASEPEEHQLRDEPDAPVSGPDPAGLAEATAAPSPMGGLPVGATFGTVVHRVFEEVDFAAAELDDELLAAVAARGGRLLDAAGQAALAEALRTATETPLGPLAGGSSLRSLSRRDRLDELVFELPLAGGERPASTVTVEAIAELLEDRLAGDDPLAGYAERLRDPQLRGTLRGYLTGSIDLLARLPARAASRPRFAVIDYKTNWLAGNGEELLLAHYRPGALREEMLRAHYALQALLYCVAAHRFLRWRLPGYVADADLAGVLYLFLRGMAGPQTPLVDGGPCGVFAWRPPAGLVSSLSDLLDAGVEP